MQFEFRLVAHGDVPLFRVFESLVSPLQFPLRLSKRGGCVVGRLLMRFLVNCFNVIVEFIDVISKVAKEREKRSERLLGGGRLGKTDGKRSVGVIFWRSAPESYKKGPSGRVPVLPAAHASLRGPRPRPRGPDIDFE